MAVEVRRTEFAKASSLFEGFPYDRSWLTAALASADSRMFVDDPSSPGVALLCYRDGLCLIAGEPNAETALDIIRAATESSSDPPRFSWVSLPSDEWADVFRSAFGCRFYVFQRVSLTFERTNTPLLRQPTKAPDGFTLSRIDLALARRITEEIDRSFGLLWPSPEEFVEKSLGFCLTEDDTIVTVAYSAFEPKERMCLSVATVPDHRGRGFAAMTCAPLVRRCLENDVEPEWGASLNNRASLSVARKLGFANEVLHHWAQRCPFNADRRAVEMPPSALEEYVGEYRGGERMLVISRKGALLFFHEELPRPRLPEQELAADAHDSFFMRALDAQLLFKRGESGNVSSFVLHIAGRQHMIERVG